MPTATVLLSNDDQSPNGPEQSLYFQAGRLETGRELYRIEAGSSIPILAADINPGPSWSEPSGFFVL
jgi:ELWxxDGT repeat protein